MNQADKSELDEFIKAMIADQIRRAHYDRGKFTDPMPNFGRGTWNDRSTMEKTFVPPQDLYPEVLDLKNCKSRLEFVNTQITILNAPVIKPGICNMKKWLKNRHKKRQIKPSVGELIETL